jgi:hypothetical protein
MSNHVHKSCQSCQADGGEPHGYEEFMASVDMQAPANFPAGW